MFHESTNYGESIVKDSQGRSPAGSLSGSFDFSLGIVSERRIEIVWALADRSLGVWETVR